MLEAIFLFLFIMIILVVAETDAMVTSAIGECTSKKNKKVGHFTWVFNVSTLCNLLWSFH